MSLTDHQAKYFAHSLSLRDPEGIGRLSQSLFDAQVDLNPHQIEAALFALQSPLSKGVILADEVGLGKTIEAGLILCQLWAEKKRRILIICPASIRKQWALELQEKFHLSCRVLDTPAYRKLKKGGHPRPFDAKEVLICSYAFANRHQDEIRSIPFDLAVIDEAHKLRNCYRPSNRTGQGIRYALEERKKILLTATPLQNSLLEIYGLSILIDENLFGDRTTFATQYMRAGGDLSHLRHRLRHFCKRTLRRDVTEYINYTERKALTHPFEPTDEEQTFYDEVSTFIQREDLYCLPEGQRHLLVLILRKLLASSTEAILGTLQSLLRGLHDLRDGKNQNVRLIDDLTTDSESGSDLLDELLDQIGEAEPLDNEQPDLPPISITALTEEIADLEKLIAQGLRISLETKTKELLTALRLGFDKMAETGANERALIFTESRRTQDALALYLEENGYRGKVILFNGSNNDPAAKAIYEQWLAKNADTDRISGSRPIDIRTALVEHFRDHGTILIATEAAAEGVNMQFCSLVINFDLPWNPQRVEQRIGRCHRYGQKHDVVVINFLNTRNQADRRVHQLLAEKFRLFDEVFGASDEVLGAIESGVDFEKRVLAIYQTCRNPEQIEAAFNQLQDELKEQIENRLSDTREALLEHFDEDVHQRLKLELAEAELRLDRIARQFWQLSRHIIADSADWHEDQLAFTLRQVLTAQAPRGTYHLISRQRPDAVKNTSLPASHFLFRLTHPLGEYVLAQGQALATPAAALTFDLDAHPTKISQLDPLRGKSGYLRLHQLTVQSYETEHFLLVTAHLEEDGQPGPTLDPETAERLLTCTCTASEPATLPPLHRERLDEAARRHREATLSQSIERNNRHFRLATEQIDRWADDKIRAAEAQLVQVKAEIRALRNQARQAETLEDQHRLQEDIRRAEKRKRRARREIDDIEDDIENQRDQLISELEGRLSQGQSEQEHFSIHFHIR
ncbi:SNF2-related protein [Roseibacillus ishigakijimensis]|uniref:DEAD/DEAH box helicase n=1 Tax=Roseibacillus ishigakijimensis TaxID=454146 RepID=A0A934RW54_9BACT|nr:SNF2-related protein [Roseibacillus ishigakijimensis]MBK1835536.1 DEAD/DEAH box helicase [Roseibacillus ishigakijimensis]